MKDEELEEVLLDNELDGATYFTGDNYDTAILGYTDDGRIVYSYEKMIEWLIEKDDLSYTDAQEWIDYNTIRTVPYMGEKYPIIVYDLQF